MDKPTCFGCGAEYDEALIELVHLWTRVDGKDFCSYPCQLDYERQCEKCGSSTWKDFDVLHCTNPDCLNTQPNPAWERGR